VQDVVTGLGKNAAVDRSDHAKTDHTDAHRRQPNPNKVRSAREARLLAQPPKSPKAEKLPLRRQPRYARDEQGARAPPARCDANATPSAPQAALCGSVGELPGVARLAADAWRDRERA